MSGSKFDTRIHKQRVAHIGANNALLKDLEHKKQSITQVLTNGNLSPKKNLSNQRQSTLDSLFVKSKRQKISKSESEDEEFIDDEKADEESTESSTSSDDDDLAIGGTSTGWLSKKSSSQNKPQVSNRTGITIPSLTMTSAKTIRPSSSREIKLPSPPPINFTVKRRAVLSSEDEDDKQQQQINFETKEKSNPNRKPMVLSDEDDNEEKQIECKNDTIVLSADEDEEWLDASNPPKTIKKDKKVKKKENRAKKGTLKALKKKVENLRRKQTKNSGSEDDDDYSGADSDGDGDLREQSFDSDDSEAGEHLTAKQLRKVRELEQKCLEFVNAATQDELAACEKFNQRFLEFVLEKRPFGNFNELKKKAGETTVLGTGKRGVPANLARVLDSYMEWLENRGVLDQVLDDCREHSKAIEEAVEEAKHKKAEEKPSSLNPNYMLHPYQQIGLNWLIMMNKLGLNAILADEMGLGKTIQLIAFLAWAKEHNVDGPHLIVVPSSTIENWMQEIAAWAPGLRVLTYYGSIEQREQLRYSARKHVVDLILTTYNMVNSRAEDRKFFKRYKLNYVIYDEGHMLRNCATQRYSNLMRIHGKRKILLTGTPLQNNLVELISLLYFTMRKLFDKYCDDISSLLQMFAVKGKILMDQKGVKHRARKNVQDEEEDEAMELDEQSPDLEDTGLFEKHKIIQAKSILQPFVLRRLKIEVLNCLPKKHERIEFCEPTIVQKELYQELLDNLRARKESGGGAGLDLMMQMRQVACHPLLYRHHYNDGKVVEMANALCQREKAYEKKRADYLAEELAYETDIALHLLCQKFKRTLGKYTLGEHLALNSAKCNQLDQLLPEIIKKGEKVLIFSQFTTLLDILEIYLNIRQYDFIRLDGSTPVLERQELIDMFNKNPCIPVFLLSTKAGGLGINLTAANHIIIHDIDMNPYNDKQAEDRVHRMGQTKEVFVTRLICKDTIEEKILALAEQKLQLERNVTTSAGIGDNKADLSKEGMDELLLQQELLEPSKKDAVITNTS